MRIIPFLPTVILLIVATTGNAQIDSTAKTTNLKTVTVTARKPLLEQKADRLIVNVDAFISNTGANVLDALGKAPGVQVDKEGNISLKGKQGVMVLIDGRPAYLSGADLVSLLKGMQAAQFTKVASLIMCKKVILLLAVPIITCSRLSISVIQQIKTTSSILPSAAVLTGPGTKA